jgi:hypothetical protein
MVLTHQRRMAGAGILALARHDLRKAMNPAQN